MRKNTRLPSVSRHALNWRASISHLRASAAMAGISALVLGAALAPSAHAVNDAWSTAPANNTFTGTNWTTGATTPGAANGTIASSTSLALYFGTSSITALNENETAGFNIGSFTFNAGAAAFTITGNSFALANGITNNSTNLQTISDAFTIASGTHTFTGAGNLTLGGAISGAGGFTKTGAGTLTLSGANTFNGGTTVSAGTLSLGAGGQAGTVKGVVTVNSGATLNLAGNDALGYGTGNVTTVNVIGGTVTSVAGNNEGFLTSFNLTGGTVSAGSFFRFNVNAATPPGISSLASATTSTFAANIDDFPNSGTAGSLPISVAKGTTVSGVDLLISGVIGSNQNGLNGLTKTGAGTLALTGANTYTGGTTISAGTLQVGNGGTTGSLAAGSAITDNGSLVFNRTNAVVQGTDFGTAAITGTGSLTQAGTGNLTLNVGETYTGGTTVNAGTLTLATGGAAGAVQGVVTVNAGATLSLTATDALGYNSDGTQVTTLNVNGGTVDNAAADGGSLNEGFLTQFNLTGATVTSSGGGNYFFDTGVGIKSNASAITSVISAPLVARDSALTFNVAQGTTPSGVDLSVTGVIQDYNGNEGITKTGAGTLSLSGNNVYTGPTNINAGKVIIGVGGGLYSFGAAANYTDGNGNVQTTGAINVAAGATLRFDASDSLGDSASASAVVVTVNGGTLASNNSYTSLNNPVFNGATIIDNGGASAGFNAFRFAGTVTVGGNAATNINAGTTNASSGINLGGNYQGTTTTTFNVGDATGSAASDLNVNVPLLNTNTAINPDTNTPYVVSALTKTGAGTMTLNATNTYTGPTTVNGGNLVVTGSTAAASAVTVNNSGTILSGTGTVAGTVTVNSGAIISAGNKGAATPTPGTLTTGALTLATGSTFDALLASQTSFSTLSAAGTTSLAGAAFSISLTPGATFTNGQILELITSPVTGTFSDTTYTVGGYTFTADYTTNAGFFDVDVASAVPEPATWLAGGLLVGMVGVSRRRKIRGWLTAVRA